MSPSLIPRSRESFSLPCLPYRPSRLQFGVYTDFKIELFPVHSPLLEESLLVSFPPLSYMLKFSGSSYLISGQWLKVCLVSAAPKWSGVAQRDDKWPRPVWVPRAPGAERTRGCLNRPSKRAFLPHRACRLDSSPVAGNGGRAPASREVGGPARRKLSIFRRRGHDWEGSQSPPPVKPIHHSRELALR